MGDAVVEFVVLTYPSQRGNAILEALAAHDLRPAAIVLDTGNLSPHKATRKLRSTMRSQGVSGLTRKVWRRMKRLGSRREMAAAARRDYARFTDDIHVVSDAGSDDALALMRRLGPDLVVLGSSRILPPAMIRIPPLGILNSHPGLLPEYRGVDTVPWAVLNGDPLGASIHFIDPGIDTGPIVRQQSFAIHPGDTLDDLRKRAVALAAELMAEAVAELQTTGTVPRVPQEGAGTLYRRMSGAELAEARLRLEQQMGGDTP